MSDTKHIYIVEDEKIVALDIKNNLIMMGYEVMGISSSGEDCLEKIKDLKLDLILMDINLAGKMNGLETAHQIDLKKSIPIVFLTAFSDDDTLRQIKKTGYYGYVTKPFKRIDLKTEIELTIDRFYKLQALKRENDQSKFSLRKTEEFFKQVVDNVSDFIYRIDLKGNFTYVNPTALQQTGFTSGELLAMKYTNLVRLDFKETAFKFFKNIFDKKILNSYIELPIITKNNKEIWIGQNIQTIMQDGAVSGFQVVARDITNEIHFKEQLILAKKNAENAALIKSQFLANMSHEIRTPLNGIIGVINLLSKTELTSKQQTYIDAIISSSNQLMGLINDVLDLSKIEAGKMEFVENEFDLYDLAQSVISIFEHKTTEKGISLNFHIDDNVPRNLIGDPIRLNQILYNLIGNAVKFTEKGLVSLNISAKVEDHEARIDFAISDSGIGMTEETLNKIFKAFTQAEGNTTRKFGGTGLGLAIVKKLVELQGGTIEVKSRFTEGSCFTFHLRFKINDKLKSDEGTETKFDPSALLNTRVLLVEDNPINQLVTRDLLQEMKVEVLVANNGREALDILAGDIDFDVILMDLQMPVLDGFETIKAIRSMIKSSISQVPILALSANVIETEIEKSYACGANNYLSKPFKPETLYQRIIDLITNSKIEHHETNSHHQ